MQTNNTNYVNAQWKLKEQRVLSHLNRIDKNPSLSSNPFQLNMDQHSSHQPPTTSKWPKEFVPNVKSAKEMRTSDLDSIAHKYTIRLKQEAEEQDEREAIKEQEQQQKSKVVICVKRKREEEPLEELFIERTSDVPRQKRRKSSHPVDDLADKLGGVQMKDLPLARFVFLESSANNNPEAITEKMKRRNLKSEVTDLHKNAKERKVQKFKDNVKKIRLLKVNEKRQLEDTRVVQIDLQVEDDTMQQDVVATDTSLNNYASLLKDNLSRDEYNDLMGNNGSQGGYYYDYYYLDDLYDSTVDGRDKVVVQLERYDQDLIFSEDEYSKANDPDYDSEDSNADDRPNYEYPDEEDFGYIGDEVDEDFPVDVEDTTNNDRQNHFEYLIKKYKNKLERPYLEDMSDDDEDEYGANIYDDNGEDEYDEEGDYDDYY